MSIDIFFLDMDVSIMDLYRDNSEFIKAKYLEDPISGHPCPKIGSSK